MKIYLIRHAQVEHNVLNDIRILDPNLTATGCEQCLNNKDLYQDATMVLSSTSKRALMTATLLFDIKNLFATDLLLEYQTGVNCNKRNTLDIQKSTFPSYDFDTFKVDDIKQELSWQDGENRAKKVIELLHDIKKYFNPPVLAVVSHANFIRNIITLLDGYKQEELDNCKAYTITI